MNTLFLSLPSILLYDTRVIVRKLTILAAAFFVLGSIANEIAFAQISSPEREALVAVYNSTDGDNWVSNYNWKELPLHTDGFSVPGTECSWKGVTCNDSEDSVTKLDLWQNNLQGMLPNEIGNLENLTRLLLGYNQLTGSIPSEIGNVVPLYKLSLAFNQLTGVTYLPPLGRPY